MNYNKVIIITGPTASNKSLLGIQIAKKVNGVIINADSSQVYKEPLILTNSPTLTEQKLVKHHLYNFITLNQHFKITDWINLVVDKIDLVIKNKQTPILIGGSVFYIDTLINGLTYIPEASLQNINFAQEKLISMGLEKFQQYINQIDPEFVQKFKDPYRLLRAYSTYLETGIPLSKWQKNPKISRLKYQYTLIQIIPERIILYKTINERVDKMIKNGALDEAHSLLNSNILPINYKKVIGLNELIQYLLGSITLQETVELTKQKTRNYAKRQITWCKNKFKNAILFNEINIDLVLSILFNKSY